ncbi:MAG TPA: SRPBCC family protein [Bacteroidia bacterium]|nr:SRPBCC family protein [Bacteroidia bacterium]HNT79506.1 SRPBCC family protein [Bacteroidia bacterium]
MSNTINKSLAMVAKCLTNEQGVKEWMEGFVKMERISGEPHQVGTLTDFYFIHRNKEMKLREEILEQNLPHQIKYSYTSTMGYNEVELQFKELSADRVQQTSISYFKFKAPMSWIAFLFTGMFKKQTNKIITAFKAYCEKQ